MKTLVVHQVLMRPLHLCYDMDNKRVMMHKFNYKRNIGVRKLKFAQGIIICCTCVKYEAVNLNA